MKTGIGDTLKSRLFAGIVHAGLWVLFLLAVMGLAGKLPDFHDSESFFSAPQSPVPVVGLEHLSSPTSWPKPIIDTNALNPFLTRHFIPPQVPAPPAPTTRKFEMTYQGFYQSDGGLKQTLVKVGENFIVTPMGGKLLSNLFVAEATMQALILTNPIPRTNVLPLNAKREIEVPLQ
jgi:hypothetical protein